MACADAMVQSGQSSTVLPGKAGVLPLLLHAVHLGSISKLNFGLVVTAMPLMSMVMTRSPSVQL
jgi:hypothetical protein